MRKGNVVEVQCCVVSGGAGAAQAGGRVRGPGDGARSMARASPARTPEFHI